MSGTKVVSSANESSDIAAYFMSDVPTCKTTPIFQCRDKNMLEVRFRRFIMPPDACTDMSTISVTPYKAIKLYNRAFPTHDDILISIQSPQGDSGMFKKARAGSMGASAVAVPVGYSKYGDNVAMFRLETGLDEVHPSTFYSDYENFDHGHYVEEEGADMYQLLMGCEVYKAGTFKHWRFPWLHVSPDRCVIYPTGVVHNKYTAHDSLRGGLELKSPNEIYACTLKDGKKLMVVPAEYMIQLQMQMRNQCWDWVDFCVHKKPRLARPVGDFGAIRKMDDGRFVVSETTICRVYLNVDFVNIVIPHVASYINSVRTRKDPTPRRSINNPVDLPSCVQVPIKWTQFILTTPVGEEDLPMKDGRINGTLEMKIIDYEDSPPLLVPMKMMMNYKQSKGEGIKILSSVPEPAIHPSANDVVNPLYVKKMAESPHKTLSDIIWDLTLSSYHIHKAHDDLTPCYTELPSDS